MLRKGRRAGALRMNPPVETLLFDFGGTLDADGVAWKERFYSYYRDDGLNMPPDAFESSFFAADSPLVGTLPPETDLPGTVHALVTNLELELKGRCAAAHKGGIVDPRSARVASRFLAEASAAFARNRPVLEMLSERYRLGIVSNFYGNLEAVCRGAGLAPLFTVLLDSHCVGAQKPDPAIFHVAFEKLGAEPGTSVLIGDSLRRDREGARRAGMRFIWIVPHGADHPEANTATQDPVEHTIMELGGLLKLLQ
jgi:HAD superfamily hydrolase (TIGR01509 family)